MPENDGRAGTITQPGQGASDTGPLIAKIKKLEADAKALKGLLSVETGKRQEAEEGKKWLETLSGDVPEGVRDQIYKENLEISRRSEELAQREKDIAAAKLDLERKSIIAEFGIDATELEDIETPEAMRVKALETKNATLQEAIEKGKAGGFEFGAAISAGVAPKDMTDEQFEAHLKGLKDGWTNRQFA